MSVDTENANVPAEEKDSKSPRLSQTKPPIIVENNEKKSTRLSPNKPQSITIEDKELKSPRTSPIKPADSSEPTAPQPPKSPSSKVNFQRPQPGRPVQPPSHRPTMQRQMGQALQRVGRMMPTLRQDQVWMYAAAYVAVYTLFLLFRMSTFGFICIMMYTILITMLILRHFGHGPLADQNSRLR